MRIESLTVPENMGRMEDSKALYLDLMKKCLTYYLWGETFEPLRRDIWNKFPQRFMKKTIINFLTKRGIKLVHEAPFNSEARENGRDWPLKADTMIGLKRLDNLQACLEDVIHKNIPGDIIETGVWRGGATIFMRAVLKAYGIIDRVVWVADSFEGLPAPNADKYPADAGLKWHTYDVLQVSLEEVKANFIRYGLLDEQVRFLKGWFKDSLPLAPMQKLAVLRLDGDMYESTMDALVNLYPKLSVGGYVIIDDYGIPEEGCRLAVHDFRASNNIKDEIKDIDGWGAYWQRS